MSTRPSTDEAESVILLGTMSAHDREELDDNNAGMVAHSPVRAPSTNRFRGIMLLWIILNVLVTITNHRLLSKTDFPLPATLYTGHMLMTSIAYLALRAVFRGPIEPAQGPRSLSRYFAIGSVALMAGIYNIALVSSMADGASISFIQMVTIINPHCAILIAHLCGLRATDSFAIMVSCLGALGSATALAGEKQFSWLSARWFAPVILTGILRPVIVEQCRSAFSLRPSSLLAIILPVGASLSIAATMTTEGFAIFQHVNSCGYLALFVNGLLAAALNLTSIHIIQASESSEFQFAIVIKTLLLIAHSHYFEGSVISDWQYTGMGTAIICTLILSYSSWIQQSVTAKDGLNTLQSRLRLKDFDPKWRLALTRSVTMMLGASSLAVFALYPHYSPHHYIVGQLERYHHWAPEPVLAPGDNRFGKYTLGGRGLDIIPAFNPDVDIPSLPRLAWVVVATTDAVAEYRDELAAMSCWASRHGIPFYLETHLLVSDRDFMTARHANVAKHLRNYQWVMHTDADFIPMDSTQDLKAWLDDAVDLILQDRPPEICACFYFIKNSPGGWSFLQRFMAWADNGSRCNRDNGDLQEMIGAALQPGPPNNPEYTGRFIPGVDWVDYDYSNSRYERCLNNYPVNVWTEYHDFTACSFRQLSSLRDTSPTQNYGIMDLWAFTDVLPSTRMKMHFSMGGPLRFIEGSLRGNGPFGHSFPGDVMGTGKKLGVYLPEAAILCDGRDWVMEPRLNLDQAHEMLGSTVPWATACWDSNGNYRCETRNT